MIFCISVQFLATSQYLRLREDCARGQSREQRENDEDAIWQNHPDAGWHNNKLQQNRKRTCTRTCNESRRQGFSAAQLHMKAKRRTDKTICRNCLILGKLIKGLKSGLALKHIQRTNQDTPWHGTEDAGPTETCWRIAKPWQNLSTPRPALLMT